MKSSKTQTKQFVEDVPVMPPPVSEPHFRFSPNDHAIVQQPSPPEQGYVIPRAIPLGKPRLDSQAPMPSRVVIRDKTATVTTSFPPISVSNSKPIPVIRKPNTVLVEVQSDPKKRDPELQIQVQPAVNIESSLCGRFASSTPSIPAETVVPSPSIHASEELHAPENQEENIFPGTNFLSVTDISQEADFGLPNSAIELDGLPSPPAALYHGPAFPPQPPQSTTLTEPILSTIQHRETLENRMVDWVEQQIMARVISGMFPQPGQASDPANQTEPDNSLTSDIVEAAGGGGLQLFVDTGVPVDSNLIRHYVNEVLAETVAQMLGERGAPAAPTAPVQTPAAPEEVATVPTPTPTPEPMLKKPLSPVRTPDLSEHNSTAQSHKASLECASPGPDRIPLGTPTTTPIPSPSRVPTPSPPPANQTPESERLQTDACEGTELPLEDTESQDQQLPPAVIPDAQEDHREELFNHPSSPLPSKPTTPPLLAPASETSSSSASESSSSSSVTATETEIVARHISEGELLLTDGQMVANRVLEQEGVVLPNLITSLNSSLHGVQDMDYDPPSEGQVIRAPLLPAHHDPVLSLLARMGHGSISQSQHPQSLWEDESSGEVSEGQRPVLTAAEERILAGQSLIDQRRCTESRETHISPHATLSSPGEVIAEHTGAVVEDSGLPVNLRSLEEQRKTEADHVRTVSYAQPEASTVLRTLTRPRQAQKQNKRSWSHSIRRNQLIQTPVVGDQCVLTGERM
ncbi:hypothetical protein DNTS_017511 [Danionella cerebrum]|uniref:Protein TALPID3 n=1 Tax=Danionella cerebrum TaxID=2873325 RepID=A0A553R8E8_9TELE|nr:hypothetical protein DNTS_017511 [Danionella translucida]